MGRLSLRREANIRWRFFTGEVAKQLQPPLVVRDADRSAEGDGALDVDVDRPLIGKRKGTGTVGLEKVFTEMERVAAARGTGRASASTVSQPHQCSTTTSDGANAISHCLPTKNHPSDITTAFHRPFSRKARYLRRRVAEILSRTPILVETPSDGRLSVATSPLSRQWKRPPVATAADIAWIEYADEAPVNRAPHRQSSGRS